MNEEINENLKKISTWKRLAYMLVYAVIDSLVNTLLWLVIVIQVITALLTGSPNSNILAFGRNLAIYHYHILLFLTFNNEQLPFPFSDWQTTLNLEQFKN